ncbi:MAG: 3-terminal-phosphate cyclase [Chthonomonadaceae bacterium]|nr:3-terminal-phosphate cyclase [Chthonomonadaceae bacterium]
MASPTLQIDGAFGEGGGQIIRTSVALAAITGQNVDLFNIRARRSKPGLQAQHLTAVQAAAALCNAEVHGAELGSVRLHFTPGKPTTECDFTFDIAAARGGASAGATGLVAQTILAPLTLLFPEETRFHILGGTHVPMAPPADYLETVYAPVLQRMGFPVTLRSDRSGFFPRGGGAVHLKVQPRVSGQAFDVVERGRLKLLRLFLITSDLPDSVAERGRDALLKELRGYGVPVKVEMRDLPSNGAGAAVVLVAECEQGIGGWTSLGERGKPMERVALEALRDFQKWFASEASVDAHLADQLVLPAALVPATSRWTTSEVTDHLRTVLFVVRQFLPIEYAIDEVPNGNAVVTVSGVDLRSLKYR